MHEYTNSQMKSLIEEYIHSERDRRILFERLVNGLSFEAISGIVQMSDRQIKNIVYRAERELFRHLHENCT